MDHPFKSLTYYDLASSAPKTVSGEISEQVVIITRLLADEQKAFLSKILAAVNLTPDDFSLIEFDEDTSFRLSDHLSIDGKIVLFFGVTPHDAGLALKATPYRVVRGYRFTCLFCDHVKDIADNQLAKRQLWEALKNMFPNKQEK